MVGWICIHLPLLRSQLVFRHMVCHVNPSDVHPGFLFLGVERTKRTLSRQIRSLVLKRWHEHHH